MDDDTQEGSRGVLTKETWNDRTLTTRVALAFMHALARAGLKAGDRVGEAQRGSEGVARREPTAAGLLATRVSRRRSGSANGEGCESRMRERVDPRERVQHAWG